jgi:hypothetical protein
MPETVLNRIMDMTVDFFVSTLHLPSFHTIKQ